MAKIHVLNCGSMEPFFLKFLKIKNGITCLLVETNQGPVLIDTGFGLNDYLKPNLLMRFFMLATGSVKNTNETALRQVERLGFCAADVAHILMTHLHIDHAGGLPDFPHAQVHIYAPEHHHIDQEKPGWEYVPAHWAHHPHWQLHALGQDRWYDFDAIHLPGFDPEIWLVPLTGHTPGHAAYAVRTSRGWVVHAGDAVPFNVDVDHAPDAISKRMLGPHVPRLRQFIKTHPEVHVIGAHMEPDFYKKFATIE